MPVSEYFCENCRRAFITSAVEHLDRSPTCPQCSGEDVRALTVEPYRPASFERPRAAD